jgi:hypothetical protein
MRWYQTVDVSVTITIQGYNIPKHSTSLFFVHAGTSDSLNVEGPGCAQNDTMLSPAPSPTPVQYDVSVPTPTKPQIMTPSGMEAMFALTFTRMIENDKNPSEVVVTWEYFVVGRSEPTSIFYVEIPLCNRFASDVKVRRVEMKLTSQKIFKIILK